MKNTIITILKTSFESLCLVFLIISFSFSGFLSCATVSSIPLGDAVAATDKRIDTRPPVDAFAFVGVKHIATPTKCLDSPAIEKCKEVIKKLPVIEKAGMGSGLLVNSKAGPVVLTAGHVCLYDTKGFRKGLYAKDKIKIEIKIKTIITVRISTGEILASEVVKIDNDTDLCALKPSKIFTKPVEWSRKPPRSGDKVFSISAPVGINTPTMNLIFSGFYSGYIGHLHHYTIPTRPGSSGSVVLDESYRGVGMLNAAYINMESIGLGTGYHTIKKFLDSL